MARINGVRVTDRERKEQAVTTKMTFIPVNRIGEDCACCGRPRGPKAVRGVRAEATDGLTFYYCDVCIPAARKGHDSPVRRQ